MAGFALADAKHVLDVAPGRLLAEHVETAVEPGDGHVGGQVVRKADEEHVELLGQELLVARPAALAGVECRRSRERLVADGDDVQPRMSGGNVVADLADHAVTGDADPQR